MKPNILYLHSHDTGRYVSPLGYGCITPKIQGLADGGVVFRNAHSAAPTCSPSRAALLTGRSAHAAGQLGLVNRGFELPDPSLHLVHLLRSAGYRSALCGIQHLRRDPTTIGYDEIASTESKRAEHVAPAAVDYLSSVGDDPFFLDVGFFETHRTFPPATEPSDGVAVPSIFPDVPEIRRDMAEFRHSLRNMDAGVGMVLDALEGHGLARDTLVILTTDHGIAFPWMKCSLTDHGTGVMLVMRWPAGIDRKGAIDELVSHVDILPTLCDLLDRPVPSASEGFSLVPMLRATGRADVAAGDATWQRDELFAEINHHVAYEPTRSVRTNRYKLIRRFGADTSQQHPNWDGSPTKEFVIEHGLASDLLQREEMYDLWVDPLERHNLQTDSEISRPDAYAELDRRLQEWMTRTNDPLLAGRVPES